jgi:hypothetical protein
LDALHDEVFRCCGDGLNVRIVDGLLPRRPAASAEYSFARESRRDLSHVIGGQVVRKGVSEAQSVRRCSYKQTSSSVRYPESIMEVLRTAMPKAATWVQGSETLLQRVP